MKMNEAASLVSEYAQRQYLAELGFQFDGESLDPFRAEAFTIIAQEISIIERETMKKQRRDG